MRFMNGFAIGVGYTVLALHLLGSFGAGDFKLYFGPVGSLECKETK